MRVCTARSQICPISVCSAAQHMCEFPMTCVTSGLTKHANAFTLVSMQRKLVTKSWMRRLDAFLWRGTLYLMSPYSLHARQLNCWKPRQWSRMCLRKLTDQFWNLPVGVRMEIGRLWTHCRNPCLKYLSHSIKSYLSHLLRSLYLHHDRNHQAVLPMGVTLLMASMMKLLMASRDRLHQMFRVTLLMSLFLTAVMASRWTRRKILLMTAFYVKTIWTSKS